jgi:hypothetical protein
MNTAIVHAIAASPYFQQQAPGDARQVFTSSTFCYSRMEFYELLMLGKAMLDAKWK